MTLQLDRLSPEVRAKAAPFFEELARLAGPRLHSLHLVGSAATPDWVAGRSDINSLLVLHEADLAVLEAVAPLGRRFHGSGVAPPLVMDTAYVRDSLDVFPMEFLDLRHIHVTVLGEDLLAGLVIERADLRRQCEFEVKSRLVGLQQRYLRVLGEPKALTEALVHFIAGYQPLARGVLVLLDRQPPLGHAEVFAALTAAVGPDAGVFAELHALKRHGAKLDARAAGETFRRCFGATQRLGRLLDDLT